MNNILLCSSNPILVKSLYGILRDEGYNVDTIDHPSFAVMMILRKTYVFVIIDSEPFGLSAEDAVEIIKTVAPGLPIMFVGGDHEQHHARSVETPIDLEEFKRTIHSITA